MYMGYVRFFMPFVSEAQGYDFKGRTPAGRAIVESRSGASKLSVTVQDLRTEARYSVYLVFPDAGRFGGVLAGGLVVDNKGKGELRKDINAALLGKFDITKLVAVAVQVDNKTGVVTAPLVGYREKPISWKNSFYVVKEEVKKKDPAPKKEDIKKDLPSEEEKPKEKVSFVEEILQKETVEESSPVVAVATEEEVASVEAIETPEVIPVEAIETPETIPVAVVSSENEVAEVVECVTCTAVMECSQCKEKCATCKNEAAASEVTTNETEAGEVELHDTAAIKSPVIEDTIEETHQNDDDAFDFSTIDDDTLKENMERASEFLRRRADTPLSCRPQDAEPFCRRKNSKENSLEISQEAPTASLQKDSPRATRPPEPIAPPSEIIEEPEPTAPPTGNTEPAKITPPSKTTIETNPTMPPEVASPNETTTEPEPTAPKPSEPEPDLEPEPAPEPSPEPSNPEPAHSELAPSPPDFIANREDSIAALEGIFNSKKPISPFPNQSDDTIWVRLTINDAVPLPQSLPNLLEESFVRAAYANFGHLILGLSPDRAEYAIGVPGEYSQELRPQAKNLGFSSFRTGRNELVRPGDKGYWLLFVGL